MNGFAVDGGIDIAAASEEQAVESLERRRIGEREHARFSAGSAHRFDVVGEAVAWRDANYGH
jgi:hypothetical protein